MDMIKVVGTCPVVFALWSTLVIKLLRIIDGIKQILHIVESHRADFVLLGLRLQG
jgi:hypothetical protein